MEPRSGNPGGEILVAVVVLLMVGAAFVAALVVASAERAGSETPAPPVAQDITGTAPIIILPTRTDTPTNAPTQTATMTPTPRATVTASPTGAPTDVPTATGTTSPTATSTATGTPSLTATSTPSRTATATVTLTATPSSTATASRTATATTSPTATVTTTPTASPLPSPSLTPIGECGPPAGWVTYTIQRGDTLAALSARYRTTIGALRAANCLTSDLIFAGRQFWVPNVTPRVTATLAPAPTINPTTAVAADPCSNLNARITAPRDGGSVTGTFWVEGAANIPDFARYEIELRRDGTSDWMNQGTYYQPVTRGHLARIDPAQFGSGKFWIRLTVVDSTSNYPPRCAVLVSFP